MKTITSLLLMLTMSAPGYAQMQTVKDYNEMKAAIASCKADTACSAKPTFEALKSSAVLYLKGIGDGYVWANGVLESQGRPRLYCTPEKLGMNSDNYEQILESFLPTARTTLADIFKRSTWKSVDELPLGFALLLALMDAFPCNTGQTQVSPSQVQPTK